MGDTLDGYQAAVDMSFYQEDRLRVSLVIYFRLGVFVEV
jgi:hypothetical protein